MKMKPFQMANKFMMKHESFFGNKNFLVSGPHRKLPRAREMSSSHKAICKWCYFFVSLGIFSPLPFLRQLVSQFFPAFPLHIHSLSERQREKPVSCNLPDYIYVSIFEIPKCIVSLCVASRKMCVCFWSHKMLQQMIILEW
jgi:hypothetical protein